MGDSATHRTAQHAAAEPFCSPAREPAADAPMHAVRFYDTEPELVGAVTEFLCDGLTRAQRTVVIATAARRTAFEAAIAARGVDVARARATGQLVLLDAEAMLSEIIVDGMPDRQRFEHAMAGVIPGSRAPEDARVYGEMVDVLWRRGQAKAAIDLEELWNELQRTQPIALLCAYLATSFERDLAGLQRVFSAHASIEPAVDAVPAMLDGEAGVDAAARVRLLAAELAYGKRVEHALRDSLRELRHAEEEHRAAVRRDERLLKITAAIADAVTREQVYEALVDQVASAVGASSAGLWLLAEDGASVTLARALGYSEPARKRFECFSVHTSDRFPALDALRSGAPVWIDSQRALLERYPELASTATPGRAYRVCCLPLIVRGRTLGVVGFTFEHGSSSEAAERGFLLLVARYTGQALERLRLLQAEQRSRAQSEAAAERMAVLSRASRALSEAGHDLPTLLQALAEQVTPEQADGCGIALVAGDILEPAALLHRDPAATASLRLLVSSSPVRVGYGATGRVAQTGEPVFLPALDLSALTSGLQPEHRAWIERHPLTSLIIVPLRTRGRIVGTLSALRTAQSPAFEPQDLQLLTELAERAATAIENSRLYRENQQGRMRAELLYGLAAKVIGAERVEQVFEAALDAIERALGTQRSSILAFDRDGVMRFKAYRGLSDAYRNAVEGHSPWSRDERAPRPVLVPDAAADPAMADYLALFRQENIAALHFIPLVAAGTLIGKFMVYYERPRALSASELEMATAIANHVATALNRFAAVAELQQTVRFNEMFAGVLGHDLRNPLNAIMTAAQLLVQRAQGERAVRPLQRILASGTRMARMIDQLLDFTRVRVGTGIPLDPRPADMVVLLEQVIDELHGASPEWSLRVQRAGDTQGVWDVDRLLQVFSNLVANALQHGDPAHGVSVHVDGTAPDVVEVRVHNMGAIPAGLLPRLFEPMAGGERHRGTQGLGLGLYITREIVRAHAGRIDTQSSAHEGTTFSVRMPRRCAIAGGARD